jgi:hypothetical protein
MSRALTEKHHSEKLYINIGSVLILDRNLIGSDEIVRPMVMVVVASSFTVIIIAM